MRAIGRAEPLDSRPRPVARAVVDDPHVERQPGPVARLADAARELGQALRLLIRRHDDRHVRAGRVGIHREERGRRHRVRMRWSVTAPTAGHGDGFADRRLFGEPMPGEIGRGDGAARASRSGIRRGNHRGCRPPWGWSKRARTGTRVPAKTTAPSHPLGVAREDVGECPSREAAARARRRTPRTPAPPPPTRRGTRARSRPQASPPRGCRARRSPARACRSRTVRRAGSPGGRRGAVSSPWRQKDAHTSMVA